MSVRNCVTVLATVLLLCNMAVAETPAAKAVRFLAREVPAWSVENECFSCHNNGDGARALYRARQHGYEVSPEALATTQAWLLRPDRWEQDLEDAEFKDGRLARIQFAATLVEVLADAADSDQEDLRKQAQAAVRQAARRLAADQASDGQWPLVTGGSVAAPATYGPILCTHFARRVLQTADAIGYAAHLSRSQRWLEQVQPSSVLDAAGLLWALAGIEGRAAARRREQAADLLRRAQNSDGGWGPYLASSAEPFDTAVALIALCDHADERDRPRVVRGRDYLIARQQADGSWPATTRPGGVDSYAEYISTTAWTLQALLLTADRREKRRKWRLIVPTV